MSSQLTWHSENQVLHLHLSGNITPETLLKNSEFIAGLLDETHGNRVHVIMDLLHASQLPKDTGSLRNVLAPMLTHHRMGWTVVITSNLMMQSVLNRTVSRLTERWGYVNSLPEAADFLRRADSHLVSISSTDQHGTVLFNVK